MKYVLPIAGVVLVFLGIWFFLKKDSSNSTLTENQSSPTPQATRMNTLTTQPPKEVFFEPVEGFRERITKKPFGISITPENSPIQPERFRGFHTGADSEFEDVEGDVVVRAVAGGTIVLARRVSGYGGVVVIEHLYQNKKIFALYGHLDPKSIPPINTTVTQGQQIGILGDGGTEETDGERKHLHFGVLNKDEVDLRGYVPEENELVGWMNPLDLYR
jgi:murein DD-endopeptidase MepM/ murein hydrolase activator NlpD